MDKAQLRQKLQRRLLEMTEEQRNQKSKRACKNLISTPQFQSASAVMLYLSLPHEVDTSEAILYAWQHGKTVVVPKVSWQQRHMIPVQINSLETGLSTGASGLRNPVTGVPMPTREIDLVVTPAVGFDGEGNRLGRGGCYYDRFFANEAWPRGLLLRQILRQRRIEGDQVWFCIRGAAHRVCAGDSNGCPGGFLGYRRGSNIF
jgi:5-formyltetrahydrofolate cyclo-ligase